jgi:hypothetical protein
MTSDERSTLLKDLGIDPGTMREIEQIPLGGSGVAQGLRAGKSSARDLSESFVELVHARALPFALTQHALEPRVVRVEGAVVRATSGAAESIEGAVLLDARYGRSAGVVVESAEGPMLIDVDAIGIRITYLAPVEDLSALERSEPLPTRLSSAAPALPALLGNRSCEPWLRQRVEALASSSWLVDHVASVGTVVRLWSPTPTEGREILEGRAAAPSAAAGAWIRELLRADRDAVEQLAVQQAITLRAWFDGLADAPDDPTWAEVLRALHERDALESVRSMLWLAGPAHGLTNELALLDDAAAASLSAIAPLETSAPDELLQAVFASEPEAWWGELAAG